jgi:hypothetical protein
MIFLKKLISIAITLSCLSSALLSATNNEPIKGSKTIQRKAAGKLRGDSTPSAVTSNFGDNAAMNSFAPPNKHPNEVIIIGRPQGKNVIERAGQSLEIVPKFSSENSLKDTLKTEVSGRILTDTNTENFYLPSIGGFDALQTRIMIDDIGVQSAYSGLPVFNNLDLRALGAVEFHRGLAPFDISESTLGLTMRFRLLPVRKKSWSYGIETGQPRLWKSWLAGTYFENLEHFKISARLFLKRSFSTGNYSYFDDLQTPFQTTDDRVLRRQNNSSSMFEVLPFFDISWEKNRIRMIGRRHLGRRGIPAAVLSRGSDASELNSKNFYSIQYKKTIAQNYFFLTNYKNKEYRHATDRSQEFLQLAEHSKTNTSTLGYKAGGLLHLSDFSLSVQTDFGEQNVQHRLDNITTSQLTRSYLVPHLGIKWTAHKTLVVEGKHSQRSHQDRHTSGAKRSLRGSSSGVGFYFPKYWMKPYVQYSTTYRLPTLVEEFGDGGEITSAQNLNPEDLKHLEFGAATSWKQITLRALAYRNILAQKIIFIPTMGQQRRATNLDHLRIDGQEIHLNWPLGHAALEQSLACTTAFNESTHKRTLLPGVPEWLHTTELSYGVRTWAVKWLSQYRSQITRTMSQDTYFNPQWLHDATLDYRNKDSAHSFGVRVSNVFNKLSAEVRTTETTAQIGATSYSDASGLPIAGRSFRIWWEQRL